MLKVNSDIPDTVFARMEGDTIVPVRARDLFAEGTYVLVGLPGVFTPVCSYDHMPSLINSADALKAAGVKGIYVVSDDNPWAIDFWKKTFKNNEKLEFLCDGNRDFLNASKLACSDSDLFLRGHYGRFYAIIEDNVIRRVRAEVSVLNTVCTNGDSILSDIDDVMQQANMRASRSL